MGDVLVLRTCNENLRSYQGFQWPESGSVKCDDWNPKPVCGNGLHGLLWGAGNGSLLDWGKSAKWLVVRAKKVVDIGGDKVKFARGEVIHCGDRKSATDYIIAHGAEPQYVVGAFLTGGDYATVTGGYSATVTGGDYATVTGGYCATVTGGDYATVTGGYSATVTGGDRATVTGGYYATVTGGDYATVTGGNRATVTGGYSATVTGGDYATLIVKYWDDDVQRWRIAIAYVGENGIQPNTSYIYDNGIWKEVTTTRPREGSEG